MCCSVSAAGGVVLFLLCCLVEGESIQMREAEGEGASAPRGKSQFGKRGCRACYREIQEGLVKSIYCSRLFSLIYEVDRSSLISFCERRAGLSDPSLQPAGSTKSQLNPRRTDLPLPAKSLEPDRLRRRKSGDGLCASAEPRGLSPSQQQNSRVSSVDQKRSASFPHVLQASPSVTSVPFQSIAELRGSEVSC